MYVKTEIMFPPAIIPELANVGGAKWRWMVEKVATLDETAPETLAFCLMMIRLCGCLECETDSFRALRGCTVCAQQSARRFGHNEQEIQKIYRLALQEVQTYLKQKADVMSSKTS